MGPDGSSVSGEMEQSDPLAKLSLKERRAMATYLKALPPRPGKKPILPTRSVFCAE